MKTFYHQKASRLLSANRQKWFYGCAGGAMKIQEVINFKLLRHPICEVSLQMGLQFTRRSDANFRTLIKSENPGTELRPPAPQRACHGAVRPGFFFQHKPIIVSSLLKNRELGTYRSFGNVENLTSSQTRSIP